MDALTDRAEELFCSALQLGPDERRAFLDRSCAGEAILRARVERMLERHEAARLFFEKHRPGVNLAEFSEALGPALAAGATSGAELEIGTRVGLYKLAQKLGEGGCGVVYLADQEEPVRRRVALKIIRLGMDTADFIARFNDERRALAMMNHPNIAHVLDAGATESGRLYLAMEFVEGAKITEFCDAHTLGLGRRLALFVQVCHAIQHAHQKGIIHGDIKASNVLVTLVDGAAVPKVIDFGISRAVGGEEPTMRTSPAAGEDFIGTPAYMSPEQMGVRGLDVDTRGDVYSLGALLCELLVGDTPFDKKELGALGFDEMRRRVIEQAPPRPSAKLEKMPSDEAAVVCARRRETPAGFLAVLKRDLDWIVTKALEKDRNARYQTAIGLAADVQRYLNDETVLARPPSRPYRLRKLICRNRAVFVSAAAVALALIAGLGASTWLFIREREARHEAQKARDAEVLLRRQAEMQARVATAASMLDKYQMPQADELVGDLPRSDMAAVGVPLFRPLGDWVAVRGNWGRAAEYYSVLVRLDLEQSDTATLDYTKYAVVLLELGDARTYRAFCRDVVGRFENNTDHVISDRIIMFSSLLPPEADLLAALAPFGAQAAAAMPAEAHLGASDWPVFWRCLSLALFEYRRGNYTEAHRRAGMCVDFDRLERVPPRLAGARAIAAMSLLRLGRGGEARAELAASRQLVEERFRTELVAYDDGRGWWFDWFMARILAREAEALVAAASGAAIDI